MVARQAFAGLLWGKQFFHYDVKRWLAGDPGQPALDVSGLRDRLRGILPDHALPRALREVDAIPTRGPGKPDRAAIRTLLADVGE